MRTKKLNATIVAKLEKIIPPERLLLEQPLSLHTTFRVGGPAECLILVADISEVEAVAALARAESVPLFVIGGGSNLLVRDNGLPGIALKFSPECFGRIELTVNGLRAYAGAMLKDVCAFAAAHSLSGIEFACGIPGTAGGAVYMNAGAYGGEMSECVDNVTVLCKDGAVRKVVAAEAGFSYRNSIFQHNEAIIIAVDFKLEKGSQDKISGKMQELNAQRNSKQPMEFPSAGSTFKRPPGRFVGPMLEEAGLKGYRHKGAQVSDKHAGFVINTGTASATDILELIAHVQKVVKERFDVDLHTEVKIIGE